MDASLLSNMCFLHFFLPVCGLPFQMPFEKVLNFVAVQLTFFFLSRSELFESYLNKPFPYGKSNKDFLFSLRNFYSFRFYHPCGFSM